MKEFLPIGSVLMLKGAEKRIMVTGYLPIIKTEAEEQKYDYSACLFPEGILETDKTLVFNSDQIEYIYHYGLKDEEQQEFMKIVLNSTNETNSGEKEEGIELPNLNTNDEVEKLNFEETN